MSAVVADTVTIIWWLSDNAQLSGSTTADRRSRRWRSATAAKGSRDLPLRRDRRRKVVTMLVVTLLVVTMLVAALLVASLLVASMLVASLLGDGEVQQGLEADAAGVQPGPSASHVAGERVGPGGVARLAARKPDQKCELGL